MQVVDAEYQWSVLIFERCEITTHDSMWCRDRRKLTFYFKAEKRVDFRDLTKENFRIFKVSRSRFERA